MERRSFIEGMVLDIHTLGYDENGEPTGQEVFLRLADGYTLCLLDDRSVVEEELVGKTVRLSVTVLDYEMRELSADRPRRCIIPGRQTGAEVYGVVKGAEINDSVGESLRYRLLIDAGTGVVGVFSSEPVKVGTPLWVMGRMDVEGVVW